MNRLIHQLSNLLWPNRCPGCNGFIEAEELVCERCGERMILEHDAVCHVCGKAACLCGRKSFAYDRAVAACRYADETIPAVLAMKVSQNTNFSRFAARILAERLQYSLIYGRLDCVMPVPMHPYNQRRRGYNQAALIAKEVARLMKLPYREEVLYKDRNETAQHELRAAERRKNVSSFGIHDTPLNGMRILLCDDVLTTGSTLNRCAELLRQNGAAAVVIAAAAATIPKETQKSEVRDQIN